MVIKSSTALRNDYSQISKLANESLEPIYITKNGEGDIVVMGIRAFERREEVIRLKERLQMAEEQRLSGLRTVSLDEAETNIKAKIDAAL